MTLTLDKAIQTLKEGSYVKVQKEDSYEIVGILTKDGVLEFVPHNGYEKQTDCTPTEWVVEQNRMEGDRTFHSVQIRNLKWDLRYPTGINIYSGMHDMNISVPGDKGREVEKRLESSETQMKENYVLNFVATQILRS